jgi:hypothetical protein
VRDHPLSAASRPRGAEYAALQVGSPSTELVEAGLAPDRRYLLVVALADVGDVAAAAQAVDKLAARTLAAGPLSN